MKKAEEEARKERRDLVIQWKKGREGGRGHDGLW